METQKTPNSQNSLEKEEMELEKSIFLTSDYTTKVQSSRQHGTGTKMEIEINGTKQKAQGQIHTPMNILSLTKEAKIYNGEKTFSSTCGSGKTTGQLHVKE